MGRPEINSPREAERGCKSIAEKNILARFKKSPLTLYEDGAASPKKQSLCDTWLLSLANRYYILQGSGTATPHAFIYSVDESQSQSVG